MASSPHIIAMRAAQKRARELQEQLDRIADVVERARDVVKRRAKWAPAGGIPFPLATGIDMLEGSLGRLDKVGVPERLGGDPRKNADDAYATFLEMGDREFLMVMVQSGDGAYLEIEERKGYERARDERAERKKSCQS